MEETRWQRLQAIFAQTRSADTAARERMLAELAQEHADLAAEVRALLDADGQPGLLDDLARHVDPLHRRFLAAIPGSHHTTIPLGQLRRTYATLLLERGELARAEKPLLQSLELLQDACSDDDHPNVQETKRVLTRLYEQWNKSELAERYRVPPGRFIAY